MSSARRPRPRSADQLTPSATHEAANLRPSLRVLERLLQPFGCRSREQVRTEDGGNLQGFREYRRALAPKERRQRALLPGVLLDLTHRVEW